MSLFHSFCKGTVFCCFYNTYGKKMKEKFAVYYFFTIFAAIKQLTEEAMKKVLMTLCRESQRIDQSHI